MEACFGNVKVVALSSYCLLFFDQELRATQLGSSWVREWDVRGEGEGRFPMCSAERIHTFTLRLSIHQVSRRM